MEVEISGSSQVTVVKEAYRLVVRSVQSDVDDIKYVINFDYPNSSEDYVHRIGRTARASKRGTSYTFFTIANARQAKDLIAVLQEANQQINPKLMQLQGLASQFGGRSRSRRDRGGGIGGGSRGGAPRGSRGGGAGRIGSMSHGGGLTSGRPQASAMRSVVGSYTVPQQPLSGYGARY